MCLYWVPWFITIFTLKQRCISSELTLMTSSVRYCRNFFLYGPYNGCVNRSALIASDRGRIIQHEPVLWLEQIIKLKSRRKQISGYGSTNVGSAAWPFRQINAAIAMLTHWVSRIILGKRPCCSLPSFCKQTRLVSLKQLHLVVKGWAYDYGIKSQIWVCVRSSCYA